MATSPHQLPLPFVPIHGILNARDLGGLPSLTYPGHIIKRHHIFRSASLATISPQGIQQLRTLGVKVVFDLRGDAEVAVGVEPLSRDSEMDLAENEHGIRVIRAPVEKVVDYGPEVMKLAFERHSRGEASARVIVCVVCID